MADQFLAAIKSRRTYYELEAKSPIPDVEIIRIAKEVIRHTPSSLNSQSTRFVILLGDDHRKLWDIAKDCVKAVDAASDWAADEKKLDQRRNAYGTVLLYEDERVTHQLQQKFARYSSYFPQWAEHTNAMNTLNLWTALELEGLGCNLQHFNPYIDQKIVEQWKVPVEWKLKGQLVFGTPTAPPNPNKTFVAVEERVLVPGLENGHAA
ncbi:hypothetical protein G647_02344 [Cladophialophora carrionii CBS 160.54]|uniref:Nitroreductase domain-containing protein n=1 Tax=Cladophialophora carrionii CBS 160.54 TaxID=1279043 RepID=V9DFD2_9EURO|nr:uncharacterized protein G647_02344 [Cladophialophora carrionii CBS 160.54]ETI25570.1 hypothetical protein G647_02344 [Cladophialophora carrionii CBS 160.54]